MSDHRLKEFVLKMQRCEAYFNEDGENGTDSIDDLLDSYFVGDLKKGQKIPVSVGMYRDIELEITKEGDEETGDWPEYKITDPLEDLLKAAPDKVREAARLFVGAIDCTDEDKYKAVKYTHEFKALSDAIGDTP